MKLGRNDPCHCGSGKKFKKCCLGKNNPQPVDNTFLMEDPVNSLSNQVIEWIQEEKYREAKNGCERLLKEFPDVIDGYDRFASLYEKKGEIQKAVFYYKQCLTFIENNPAGFDNDSMSFYKENIKRLGSIET